MEVKVELRGVLYEADEDGLKRMIVFDKRSRDVLLRDMLSAADPSTDARFSTTVNRPYSASMPGYGLVFDPDERHIIALKWKEEPAQWIDFRQEEYRPKWMKANVDTMLMSLSLIKVLEGKRFRKGIDIGAGSGWLASVMCRSCESVDAVEINQHAIEYMLSDRANLPKNAKPIEADAVPYLEARAAESFDLIVSNPPYVPTKDETVHDHLRGMTVAEHARQCPAADSHNFFLGTNLLSYLLETVFPRMAAHPDSAHARCVLLLTSASLLSIHLVNVLQSLRRNGIEFNVLTEEEVHLRYWFFLRTDPSSFDDGEYLWDTASQRIEIEGQSLFTGITKQPRTDARKRQPQSELKDPTGFGVGWQVVYTLEFYFAPARAHEHSTKTVPPPPAPVQ